MKLRNFEKNLEDIKLEYNFYEKVLYSNFTNSLSEKDYEIWEQNRFKFINKIIEDDKIFWQIEEILSKKATTYINDLKNSNN
jgi:hypothetical protein